MYDRKAVRSSSRRITIATLKDTNLLVDSLYSPCEGVPIAAGPRISSNDGCIGPRPCLMAETRISRFTSYIYLRN